MKLHNVLIYPKILTFQKGISPEFKEKHKDKQKMYDD